MLTDERTIPVDEQIKRSLRQSNRTPHQGVNREDTLTRLGDEVTTSPLYAFSDASLEGRLVQYERDYAFERSAALRADFKREIVRTKTEIARRQIVARNEANKSFAGQAATELEADFVIEPAIAA